MTQTIVSSEPSEGHIQPFLENMAFMIRRTMAGSDQSWKLNSIEDVLARIGRPWIAQRLPEGFYQQEPKNCFGNTWELVRYDTKLRYVEGYACSRNGILPVPHAWAVDYADRVIDTTWNDPEEAEYFGVVIPKFAVKTAILLTGYYGFLDGFLVSDYELGQPVRRLGRIPKSWEIRKAHRAYLVGQEPNI